MEYTKDYPELQNFEIGEYTYGRPVVRHWGEPATLKMGKFCSLADGVTIFLGGEHNTNWVTTYPFSSDDPQVREIWTGAEGIGGHPKTRGDVVIGNDVWIGWDAVIMSGVKIGDGAVIGARALVTKDVEPYSVVVGNPGRQVKYRFEPEIIAKLLEIQWWNWPIEKINRNLKILCSPNLNQLDQLV
jgi:acetyltransferase-like isoleucine patch superfamily enzyme